MRVVSKILYVEIVNGFLELLVGGVQSTSDNSTSDNRIFVNSNEFFYSLSIISL